MGNASEKVEATSGQLTSAVKSDEPKKLKACCACPETKKARDTCIIENGQEHCEDLIQAHLTCMRDLGFKI